MIFQPLNNRLPSLPSKPPSLLGPPVLNMTGVEGATTVLPCRVINLGMASISWIKSGQSELTVITSGPYVFSSSQKYKLLHDSSSPDWILQVHGNYILSTG